MFLPRNIKGILSSKNLKVNQASYNACRSNLEINKIDKS